MAYQFHFVSPSKLFYIRKEVVTFWEQSDLSWRIPPMCWKYCLLRFWDNFETFMFRICVYLSLTHSKLTPSYKLSWIWNLLLSPTTWVRFLFKFWMYFRKNQIINTIIKFSFATKFLFALFLYQKLFCMTYIHFFSKKNRF